MSPRRPAVSPLIEENTIDLIVWDDHKVTHKALNRGAATTARQTRVELSPDT
jgi:hypothetical protein